MSCPTATPPLTLPRTATCKQKQAAKASQTADLLAAEAKKAGDIYNAACGHALCSGIAEKAETKEKHAARAVELLRKAFEQGYKDIEHMKKDTDLDALRNRADFNKLLAEMEGKAKEKQPPEK